MAVTLSAVARGVAALARNECDGANGELAVRGETAKQSETLMVKALKSGEQWGS